MQKSYIVDRNDKTAKNAKFKSQIFAKKLASSPTRQLTNSPARQLAQFLHSCYFTTFNAASVASISGLIEISLPTAFFIHCWGIKRPVE